MIDPAWLVIIGTLAAGKLCQRFQVFQGPQEPPGAAPALLNRYVIYIALPPLVINSLQSLQLETALLWMVILPWLLLGLSVVLVLSLSRWLGWNRATTGALLMLIPLGNTSFLGYPIISATLGETALPPAVIYDQFGSFIMLSSYGLYIAARYGAHPDGQDHTPGIATMLGKILRFPPFIALVIGLLPISWPTSLLQAMKTVGGSLVPVACFAVGLQWRLRVSRAHWLPLFVGLGSKMFVLPFAAALILWWAQPPAPLSLVGIMQAGMPPMITAGAIAAASGLERDLAAAMVGFGIITAFISLPLWAQLPL